MGCQDLLNRCKWLTVSISQDRCCLSLPIRSSPHHRIVQWFDSLCTDSHGITGGMLRFIMDGQRRLPGGVAFTLRMGQVKKAYACAQGSQSKAKALDQSRVVPENGAGGSQKLKFFVSCGRWNRFWVTGPRWFKDPIVRTGLDCKSYFLLHLLHRLTQLCCKCFG